MSAHVRGLKVREGLPAKSACTVVESFSIFSFTHPLHSQLVSLDE